MAIRVGVAGWDYPDWVGPVYPTGEARRMDRLAFLSRYVDVVEINSTFYRPASPHSARSWLRRTPATLAFSAKLHRSITHERLPPTPETVGPTLDGLRPLADAGRLLCLLVQFPHGFRFDDSARGRLTALAECLLGWPWVVEVRHADWLRPEPHEWLGRVGAGWCVVDQPRIGTTAGPDPRVLGSLGYLRLHGRNAASWFRDDAGRDARYDYLYGGSELDDMAGVARTLAGQTAEVVVVQNNHFRGQALANALQLKHRIHGAPPLAPETLVRAYPGLADEVRVDRLRLF
jgi:uncharacterized protein YecE (DUF72 family)